MDYKKNGENFQKENCLKNGSNFKNDKIENNIENLEKIKKEKLEPDENNKKNLNNKENFVQKIEMSSNLIEKLNKNRLNESDFLFLETEKENKKKFNQKNKKEKLKINLKKIIGFTGKSCPDIKFYSINNKNYLIYVSGKIIILSDLNKKTQKYIKGHTDSITCFDIKGDLLISSQIGENPLSIIFDLKDLKIKKKKFNPPLKNIRTISISKNSEFISLVGETKISKDTILIYNIKKKKNPFIISKHTSDYNILSLKFSPIHEKKFLSCGRENIKFWRIREKNISGCPVVLNKYTRQTIFTILDFDLNSSIISNSKIIVGSNKGLIFIINYNSMSLLSVFKISDLAICALIVKNGFCVTAGEDFYLRVWPLDFSEFFLEAKFKGVGFSLDCSEDGLSVGVGTSEGYVGVVDLARQKGEKVISCHSGEIYDVDLYKNRLISLGNDLSIRIWERENEIILNEDNNTIKEEVDIINKYNNFGNNLKNDSLVNYKEIYQFNYTEKDECTCILFIDKDTFAAGFRSGYVRIFSISSTNLKKKISHNRNKISKMIKSKNDRYLIIGDELGIFTILDIKNNFDIIKYLEIEKSEKSFKTPISCSIDQLDRFLVILGKNSNTLDFYDLQSLEFFYSFTVSCFIHTVKFCRKNNQLFVLTCNGGFKIYEIKGLQQNNKNNDFKKNKNKDIVKERENIKNEKEILLKKDNFVLKLKKEVLKSHENYISDIIELKNGYFCSSGGDGFLKIWEEGKNYNLELIKILKEHNNNIFKIIYDYENNIIFSAGGNEGIFIWELDYLEKIKKEIFLEENQKLEIKNILENDKNEKYDRILEKKDFEKEEKIIDSDTYNFIEDIYDIKNQKNFSINIKSEKSNLKKEKPNLKENKKKSILEENENETINFLEEIIFLKQENYNFKNEKKIEDEKIFLKFKNNLSFNHYLEENSKKYIPNFSKINIRKNFLLKKIRGINISSINNLIWNIKNSTIIYFIENKLIFEKLEKNQNQKIIHFEELISGIFIMKNYDFLFLATSIENYKGFSPIYKINLQNYNIEKIHFHNKGIQDICFSCDFKYVISIGNFLDKKIGIFKIKNEDEKKNFYYNGLKKKNDFENDNFELIFELANKKISNCGNIFYCKKFKNYYFFISNQEKIKILRLNIKLKKIEELDIILNFENIENYDITSLLSFSYNTENYLFIGTNKGELILYKFFYLEKLTKNCFKEIFRKKIENSEIIFIKKSDINKRIIFSTTGKNLYYFNFENFVKDFNINYDFKVLKFSSIVLNITLNKNYEEGLILLKNEKIKYINLNSSKTKNFTKLMSKKNQIFQIIKIEILKKKYLLIIFDNGKVNIYKYKNLEFYKTLKIKSTISFGIYLKSSNMIFLTSQEQEIFLIDCKNDFLEMKYFKIKNIEKINKG